MGRPGHVPAPMAALGGARPTRAVLHVLLVFGGLAAVLSAPTGPDHLAAGPPDLRPAPATAVRAAEATAAGEAPGDASAAAVQGATYRPVSPLRVLDTRRGLGGHYFTPMATQYVPVITPEVAADAGVAAHEVAAVVLNVTSTGSTGEAYLTVWPAWQPHPGSSNLNVTHANQTIPNLVTSPVVAGHVSVMSVSAMHIVADVQGVYVTGGGTSLGRFVALGPTRVYDSRELHHPLHPGEPRIIDVRPAGVPGDAIAVAMTLTSVSSPGAQFIVVWPADHPWPFASNLNPEHGGQTVANQVISGLDAGRVRVMGTAGGHVILDVAGYYTGPSAGSGDEGLFVPLTPARLVDTRQDGHRPWPGATVEVGVSNREGVPGGYVSAVALNVTATQANAAGFVTVWGARAARPNASVLNPEYANQTVPSHVITPVTDVGFAMYTPTGTHLLADIAGYFTGPSATGGGLAPPPAAGPHDFLYKMSNGGIARWDPCTGIRYMVNDDVHATPGGPGPARQHHRPGRSGDGARPRLRRRDDGRARRSPASRC
ncbi:MAG: hypothetical protein GEV08_13820 [Acidimicrobiia bacterium]|nr:hypothetical protein [Acidimicrobiia bacterium]